MGLPRRVFAVSPEPTDSTGGERDGQELREMTRKIIIIRVCTRV